MKVERASVAPSRGGSIARIHQFLSTGPVSFETRVQDHLRLLKKRARTEGADPFRHVMAAEHIPPIGQAGNWYQDAIRCVPRSGRDVAKQIARLCGDDSQVTVPWRSLADAVGVLDKAGRHRAYTERGARVLTESGWLGIETVGEKRGARTTFYLLPGDRIDWLERPEAIEWLEAEAALDDEDDSASQAAA